MMLYQLQILIADHLDVKMRQSVVGTGGGGIDAV